MQKQQRASWLTTGREWQSHWRPGALMNPTLISMCYCYREYYKYMFNLQQSYQSIPACQEQVEGRRWNLVLNGLEKEILRILRNISLLLLL